MSRHKDLYDALWERMRHYDPQTADAETNELIDNYRDEVLREAAAKQREALARYQDWRGGGVAWPNELEEWVIDPIDPDKGQ